MAYGRKLELGFYYWVPMNEIILIKKRYDCLQIHKGELRMVNLHTMERHEGILKNVVITSNAQNLIYLGKS